MSDAGPATRRETWETLFQRDLLLSESRRSLFIAALLLFIMAFLIITVWLYRDFARQLGVEDRLPGVTELSVLFLAVMYEGALYLAFRRWHRINRMPPHAMRYVNALIETSLPTLIILSMIRTGFPLSDALSAPPTYVYFFFILLSIMRLDFLLSAFTGLVAATGYSMILVYYAGSFADEKMSLLTQYPPHVLKIGLYFFTGILAGYVARDIRRRMVDSYKSSRERDRIQEMFGTHVSPEVMHRLLNQPEQVTEVRHVCVMFLDIRGFTAFSERKTAPEVVAYLNTLFFFMIEIINKHNGIINKFLGDGFMAVFGAPASDGRDAENALAASLEILEQVNAAVAGGSIEATRIGIGLHAGEVLTGTVGSRRRLEYTIIGDPVNVASRVEQLNKKYNSSILATETVFASIDPPDGARRLDGIQVRNRDKPITVYRIV